MDVVKGFASSKKFWGAIGTAAAIVLIQLVPALEPLQGNVEHIFGTGAFYILGQGLADMGKEAEKVRNGK